MMGITLKILGLGVSHDRHNPQDKGKGVGFFNLTGIPLRIGGHMTGITLMMKGRGWGGLHDRNCSHDIGGAAAGVP